MTQDELFDLIETSPSVAWKELLALIERSDADDLPMLGAGVIQAFTYTHAKPYAERIETEIRSSERFFKAFQYAALTGVPLSIQQNLNRALLDRGADPKFVVEYDDGEDESGE